MTPALAVLEISATVVLTVLSSMWTVWVTLLPPTVLVEVVRMSSINSLRAACVLAGCKSRPSPTASIRTLCAAESIRLSNVLKKPSNVSRLLVSPETCHAVASVKVAEMSSVSVLIVDLKVLRTFSVGISYPTV